MSTPRGRNLDPEILALKGALFDTLPPPRPLTGRAVDHDVLALDGGLFSSLPPPPPLGMLCDSLAPVVEAELRGDLPEAPLPLNQLGFARLLGAAAGIGLMALGLGMRRDGTASASAAPRLLPTITLPEQLIVGDVPRPALPEVAAPAGGRDGGSAPKPPPGARKGGAYGAAWGSCVGWCSGSRYRCRPHGP